MTSVGAQMRTTSMDNEFYITIGDCTDRIYQLNATTARLTAAPWASTTAVGPYQSSIKAAGLGLLRDQGKTYLSGGRTFRKVQLVVPRNSASTFGVAGPALDANSLQGYLTGYIETGFDASSDATPTPVAKWGR
jgi:hypothetical protein